MGLPISDWPAPYLGNLPDAWFHHFGRKFPTDRDIEVGMVEIDLTGMKRCYITQLLNEESMPRDCPCVGLGLAQDSSACLKRTGGVRST